MSSIVSAMNKSARASNFSFQKESNINAAITNISTASSTFAAPTRLNLSIAFLLSARAYAHELRVHYAHPVAGFKLNRAAVLLRFVY